MRSVQERAFWCTEGVFGGPVSTPGGYFVTAAEKTKRTGFLRSGCASAGLRIGPVGLAVPGKPFPRAWGPGCCGILLWKEVGGGFGAFVEDEVDGGEAGSEGHAVGEYLEVWADGWNAGREGMLGVDGASHVQ